MHITFFCIGDRRTPSTRLRLLNYLPHLEAEGVSYDLVIATDRSRPIRSIKRLLKAVQAVRSDIVFIQKLSLPPFIIKQLKRYCKIIYDFDDAVYLETENQKNRSNRVNYILRESDLVIAGNQTLKNHALRYNPQVVTLPTPVPHVANAPRLAKTHASAETIGWIGSAHNLYNLEAKSDLLAKLMAQHEDVQLYVISDGRFSLDGFAHRVKNLKWDLETENRLIADFDIGLMPLEDTEWNRGKCAYKALQMMAYAKPVVASPVGMNAEVIENGINGFLAGTDDEWLNVIEKLSTSPDLRKSIGQAAARTVARDYSLEVLKDRFVRLLKSVLQ